jgi:hypothetical protein
MMRKRTGITLFHFQNKIASIVFWKWNGSPRATPAKPCLFRLSERPSLERGITSYCNAKLEIELHEKSTKSACFGIPAIHA